jgi:hypothetical protein
MHIESIQVTNYRSIFDSDRLKFSPGFNLIVGANNVGKSSLLLCLANKFGGEPHKSIRTLSYRNEPLDPNSRVEYTFGVSGEDFRRLMLEAGAGNRYVPWPADTPFAQDRMQEVLDRLFAASRISLAAFSQASQGQGSGSWHSFNEAATRLYQQRQETQPCWLQVEVNVANRTVRPAGIQAGVGASNDFGLIAAQLISQRTYRFLPERMTLGTSAIGTNAELLPDARNLAEVLNILQGNPGAIAAYCRLVKAVFPTIEWISIRPHAGNAQHGEILVWQIDPATERDDLAMPLSQCGTGVGQVLAILYVAKVSSAPRTIIIDEPGSFLNPGASRALIGILKRFHQHQYIIATHSPEIISELSDATVTIVRWDDSKTVIEQAPAATGKVAGAALQEVGARLSDVFGFDQVLWVEGQSDALSLALLRDACGLNSRRLAILPLRDTGSFRRRTAAEILGIYRTVSMGDALLPPALLFLLDRDGRQPAEIQDLIRQGSGKVKFLSRRMFENFLLDPRAIAQAFNESGQDHGITTTIEAVAGWINAHEAEFGRQQDQPWQQWLEEVDSASMLERLFGDLSDQRLTFKKTTHTPRLTALVYEFEPEALAELTSLFSAV